MTRNLQRIARTTAPFALAACALTACASGNATSTWTPAPYPPAQPTGYTPPTGPHTITAEVITDTRDYTATGYIDITRDGACALNIDFTETQSEDIPTTGTVIKAFNEPAFLSLDGAAPLDTRNPTTTVIPSFLIVHPLGVGLSAATETQSWCFLTALPYFTTRDDSTSKSEFVEYTWDTAALNAYLVADGHTFITRVLDRLNATGEERDKAAELLAESTINDAQFANVASPLTVRQDDTTTQLGYALGSSVQMIITLTPTTAQTVEPVSGTPWDFDIAALNSTSRIG